MSATFEDILLDLVDGLEEAEVDYALVGGIAVLAWGDPRTTRDIDVIARLEPADVDRLATALEPRGFSFDRPGAQKAIRQDAHFSIFHDDGFYHADVLAAHRPSHGWTLEGRRRIEIEGRECWIASPEDTIANKLVFGSEQDLQDAAGILARLDEDLDRERLEELAARLGVREDLHELEAQVEDAKD